MTDEEIAAIEGRQATREADYDPWDPETYRLWREAEADATVLLTEVKRLRTEGERVEATIERLNEQVWGIVEKIYGAVADRGPFTCPELECGVFGLHAHYKGAADGEWALPHDAFHHTPRCNTGGCKP